MKYSLFLNKPSIVVAAAAIINGAVTRFYMTIINSNRSLKNKDKKFVISRKIIKEFEVRINRLKNDRCGTRRSV